MDSVKKEFKASKKAVDKLKKYLERNGENTQSADARAQRDSNSTQTNKRVLSR
jgi:hypothetical protein